jgi:hypothetical protein
MNMTTADEVEHLRAAEFQAEQRYLDAMMSSDLSAARDAAESWMNAADALTEYVANHPSTSSRRHLPAHDLLAAANQDDGRIVSGKEPAVNGVRLVSSRQG